MAAVKSSAPRDWPPTRKRLRVTAVPLEMLSDVHTGYDGYAFLDFRHHCIKNVADECIARDWKLNRLCDVIVLSRAVPSHHLANRRKPRLVLSYCQNNSYWGGDNAVG